MQQHYVHTMPDLYTDKGGDGVLFLGVLPLFLFCLRMDACFVLLRFVAFSVCVCVWCAGRANPVKNGRKERKKKRLML